MSTTISSEVLNNEGLSSSMPSGARGHRRIVSLWQGIRAIAGQLYRSPSTINREINRNKSGFYYLAVTADNKARRRCYRRSGKLVQAPGLRRIVIHGLRKQWSPAQISAKLKLDYLGDERMRVCAETSYTYLHVLTRGRSASIPVALFTATSKGAAAAKPG